MGSNRRYGHKPKIWPEWAATIGGMIKHETQVQSSCRKCGEVSPFPLEMFLIKYGRDYNLIGHEGKCLGAGCGGSLLILLRQGDRAPWRPLSN